MAPRSTPRLLAPLALLFALHAHAQPCMVAYTFTASPMPTGGTYTGGQTVDFCFTVTFWNSTNANWFHGVVPSFGPGWDMSTFMPGPPPPTCGGSGGTWGWYNVVQGTAGTNIGPQGPGWFFDLNNDGNPGNNFGDFCTGVVNWQFCWTISVLDGVDCVNGADLGILVNTFGDSETGSWGSAACGGDPIAPSPAAVADCCTANAGTDATVVLCDDAPPVDLFTLLGGAPDPGGTWTDPSNNTLPGGVIDPATSPAGNYVYTVQGPGGACSGQASVALIIHPRPTVGTSAVVDVCAGDAPFALFGQLGAGTPLGGTWTAPGGGASTGTFTPGVSTAGVYIYTVTGTPPCTDAQATVTVNVSPLADAGGPGSLSLCGTSAAVDLLTQLAGSPQPGGVWSGPSPLANGLFDPQLHSPGSYTYTVNGQPPCPDAQATVTVTVDPAPNAGSSGSATVCSTAPSVNLFTLLGGSPQAGGTWTTPGGTAHGGTFVPGSDPAGIYTYMVAGTGACANAQATVTMTVEPAPNAGSNANATLCQTGGPYDLLPLLGGSPMPNGTWTGPGGIAFGGQLDPTLHPGGAYTYTVAGGALCPPDQAILTVTMLSQPDAGTDGTLQLCSNGPTTDLFSTLGGTPDPGGNWTDPNGLPFSGNFIPGTSPAGVYTYSINAPPPCTAVSATVTVTVVAAPPNGQAVAVSACSTDASFDLLPLLAGLPGTGTWSDPYGTATSGTVDPATAASGNYIYTLAGTPPCPAGTHTVTVTITSPPNAGGDGMLTLCSTGAATPLGSGLVGPYDAGGTWSFGGVPHGANYDPAVDAPGVYTYTVSGTAPCPQDQATVTVTEVTAPQAGSNGSLSLCAGGAPADLFPALGGNPNAGGSWTAPNGSNVAMPVDPATAIAGGYTYTVQGSAPCPSASATVQLTIDALPQAGVSTTATFCSSQGNQALFSLLGGTAQAGGTWVGPNNTPHTDPFSPSVHPPGSYVYTVSGSGACAGLIDQATVEVSVVPAAPVTIVAAPTSGCAPMPVVLAADDPLLVASCTWDPGDGTTVGGVLVNHVYTVPGTYGVSLSYVDVNGCTGTATLAGGIQVNGGPNVAVLAAPWVISVETPTVVIEAVGDAGCTWQWTVDGLDAGTEERFPHTFEPPTPGFHTVCVTATNAQGCTTTACADVLLDDLMTIYVPSAFTPNGDGFNDGFLPVLDGADPDSYVLRVFDRWGQEVFQTRRLEEAWDGTLANSGAPLADGVYVWRIDVRDAFAAGVKRFMGHVSLLK